MTNLGLFKIIFSTFWLAALDFDFLHDSGSDDEIESKSGNDSSDIYIVRLKLLSEIDFA